jgi:hypothetical protein
MAYIGWAVNNGYAVIDVNMPMHIDDPDVRLLPAITPYQANADRRTWRKKASSSALPKWSTANA